LELASYSDGPRCPFVRHLCLSACRMRMRISRKLSEIYPCVLLNANRKLDFLIQHLPPDSLPEV